MIPGIVARHTRSPVLFPEILMDFVAQTYTVDGEAVDVADLLGGGFDPGTIGDAGMSVGYEDTPIMYPTAIGALFEAIRAGIIHGCTIVAEWQKKANPPFSSDNAGEILNAFFGPDPGSDDGLFIQASQFSGARAGDYYDAFAAPSVNWNSGDASVQRIAATISRNTGSGREFAVSANGQAAGTDTVAYAQNIPAESVHLFGVADWATSVDEWFIRKFQVLAPVLPAALPALSEVESYPAGEPETGGSLSFLCHFNGADGATASTDQSANGHTITFLGNAQLDTAQAKFGASSLLLDGTGDAVSIANHASLLFGSGAFTIDIFFRMAAETSFQIMGVYGAPSNLSWWLIHTFNLPGAGDNFLSYADSVNGSVQSGDAGAVAAIGAGAWHHWLVTRNRQGLFRIGCNGTIIANGYNGDALFASTAAMVIGARADLTLPLNGWIDEVRIWKGADLYNQSSTYTVPAAPFTP